MESSKLAKQTSIYDIAKCLAEYGAIIGGGGIRDLYLNRKPKDLDVFIDYNIENEWFEFLRQSGFNQNRRYFKKNDCILDLVPIDSKLSKEDIVSAFDCDVCMWYMTDIPTPLNSDVKLATDNMVATFDLKKDLFNTSLIRADKLKKNGWSIILKG